MWNPIYRPSSSRQNIFLLWRKDIQLWKLGHVKLEDSVCHLTLATNIWLQNTLTIFAVKVTWLQRAAATVMVEAAAMATAIATWLLRRLCRRCSRLPQWQAQRWWRPLLAMAEVLHGQRCNFLPKWANVGPTTLFCLSFEVKTARNWSWVYCRTSNQAKHSGQRMLSLVVNGTILFCRMVNFLSPMVKILFPNISSPKTQSVNLFCFSILMFTSVQSLVIQNQQLKKSYFLKFGPVSEQG